MGSWREGDVVNGRVSIHYYRTETRDKPSLILAHGFSDNGLCWTRVAERLESDFDIVMVDARNHGLSGHGVGDSVDLVDDLAALIKGLELGPTIAMGHSMGAGTVGALAAKYPDLVSKIILEDPPWSEDPGIEDETSASKRREGFKRFLASMKGMSDEEILAMGQKQHPEWQKEEFPAWVQSNRQVGELALEGLKYNDWRVHIPKISCQSLLVYADSPGSGMLKKTVVEWILSENSYFEASHINGAGHNIRREQFELYMSAVSQFLYS